MTFDAYSSVAYVVPNVVAELMSNWGNLPDIKPVLPEMLSRFLEANLGALIRYDQSYHSGVKPLLEHLSLDRAVRLEVVLPALVKYAPRLSAPMVYELAGAVASSLGPEDAESVLLRALRVAHKEDAVPSRSVDEHNDGGLCRFLCSCFGHHDNRLRWRALHTARSLIHVQPAPLLACLMEMSHAEEGRLWMSMRQWLLFLFRSLSLSAPKALHEYKETLMWHASNDPFPHAGIRELAKQSILQLDAEFPGFIDERQKLELSSLNTVQSCLWAADPHGWRHGDRRKQGGWRFDFDSMDTLPYWYSPLSHCFGLHRCDVTERAEFWICDKWHVKSGECWEYDRSRLSGYEWGLKSHRHGSMPVIEGLQTYFERHAMFMAASEMIRDLPVNAGRDNQLSRWDDWIRRQSFEADPCITADVRSPVPLQPEFHAVMPEDVDRGLTSEFMARQLECVRNGEAWIVVAGDYHVSVGGATYNFSIDSAFVSPESSQSLATSIVGSDDLFAIDIPVVELSYSQYLDEAERLVKEQLEINPEVSGEISMPGFILRSWVLRYHSEFYAHSCDPSWPEMTRSWHMFHPQVLNDLGVSRCGSGLEYRSKSGEIVAHSEVWVDQGVRGRQDNDNSYGDRLHIRRSDAVSLCKKHSLDLVIRLAVRRSFYGAKEYQQKGTPYEQSFAVIVRCSGKTMSVAGDCRPRKENL